MRVLWLLIPALQLSLLPIAADTCSAGGDDDTNTPTPAPNQGQDAHIEAFSQIHQQYGDGDTRTVIAQVDFPDDIWLYDRITLNYTLSCPAGGCDAWDRLAYVHVIKNQGQADEQAVEVGRFITPYGVGGTWSEDVTDLRPILAGARTVTSFIDTWVNPGWLVDISFDFHGGVPARKAVSIQNLWWGYYGYGDPAHPINDALTPQTVIRTAGASSAAIRVFATGHGQGNTENCAEFCAKDHTLAFGEGIDTQTVWRTDCRTSGVDGQSGTYWYSRAGWCPGADVHPRTWDVSSYFTGDSFQAKYSVQDYVNSAPSSSPPYIVISGYLIQFE